MSKSNWAVRAAAGACAAGLVLSLSACTFSFSVGSTGDVNKAFCNVAKSPPSSLTNGSSESTANFLKNLTALAPDEIKPVMEQLEGGAQSFADGGIASFEENYQAGVKQYQDWVRENCGFTPQLSN
jgi:hypothetical protein